jgi:hypothetical protein
LMGEIALLDRLLVLPAPAYGQSQKAKRRHRAHSMHEVTFLKHG